MSEPWPDELRLAAGGSELHVRFDSGERIVLAAEYLRVESPSAGAASASSHAGLPGPSRRESHGDARTSAAPR